MEYFASKQLLDLFDQHKRKLIRDFYFGFCLLVFLSLMLFYTNGKSINPVFLLSCTASFITMGFIQYNSIITQSKTIIKTAITVAVTGDELIVKTAEFKIFGIANFSKSITFQMNELNASYRSYPIKSICDLKNGVIRLIDKENEIYIIFDYFNSSIKEKLQDLLK